MITVAAPRNGYRMRRDDLGRIYKVVVQNGVEGFIERVTADCLGCTEYGDYGATYGPFGCAECGYTGKCREAHWVPFDWGEYAESIIPSASG